MYGNEHDSKSLGLEFDVPVPGGRVMRSSDTGLLKYPPSNLWGYRKSPIYRGVVLWNQLDASCRKASSKECFKVKAIVTLRLLFAESQRAKGLLI